MLLMRLQKFLSKAGICSRRKGEGYIKSGLVSVNNAIVTELGTKIDPNKDLVTFKGKRVTLKSYPIYNMQNNLTFSNDLDQVIVMVIIFN